MNKLSLIYRLVVMKVMLIKKWITLEETPDLQHLKRREKQKKKKYSLRTMTVKDNLRLNFLLLKMKDNAKKNVLFMKRRN